MILYTFSVHMWPIWSVVNWSCLIYMFLLYENIHSWVRCDKKGYGMMELAVSTLILRFLLISLWHYPLRNRNYSHEDYYTVKGPFFQSYGPLILRIANIIHEEWTEPCGLQYGQWWKIYHFNPVGLCICTNLLQILDWIKFDCNGPQIKDCNLISFPNQWDMIYLWGFHTVGHSTFM